MSGIAPWSWTACYRGGGRLRQQDVDGRHHSGEIDPARLEAVRLDGPEGPIQVPVPVRLGPPAAVEIRARVQATESMLGGPMTVRRLIQVEYRYETGAVVTTLTPEGRLGMAWAPR